MKDMIVVLKFEDARCNIDDLKSYVINNNVASVIKRVSLVDCVQIHCFIFIKGNDYLVNYTVICLLDSEF